jgi:hypothetical protein
MHTIETLSFSAFSARPSNSLQQSIDYYAMRTLHVFHRSLINYINLLLVFWLKDEKKNQTYKATLVEHIPLHNPATQKGYPEGTQQKPNNMGNKG